MPILNVENFLQLKDFLKERRKRLSTESPQQQAIGLGIARPYRLPIPSVFNTPQLKSSRHYSDAAGKTPDQPEYFAPVPRPAPPKAIASTIPLPSTAPTAPTASPVSSRQQYINLLHKYEQKHGIPKNLGVALATVESQFNPNAVSRVGAEGIMQLMPQYFKDVDRFNPEQAIPAGLEYLAKNYKRFGSWDKAIAAYNMGPTALARRGMQGLYPETQGHLKKVFAEWERLGKDIE